MRTKLRPGWISLWQLLTAIVIGFVSAGMASAFEPEQLFFHKADSEATLHYFWGALEPWLPDVHQPLPRLGLLTPEELTYMSAGWNTVMVGSDDQRAVHEAFEEQAAMRPEQTALVSQTAQLTYRELNERANRLAHYLIGKRITPGTLVGLSVERSVEMVVGVLATLKAGAAYVPLDPQYPIDWLKMVIEDTRVPVLLTQQSLFERLPQSSAELVSLDRASDMIERQSNHNPALGTRGEQLAYVIHTSGSTGAPKGVEISHGGLASYIVYAGQFFALTPGDRMLQFSSISFDTAAEEIFSCLTRGATLVLRNDSMLDSVAEFLATCRKWDITVLDLPTAYWHELTARLFSEDLTMPEQMRLVVIGGEKALCERLLQWQARVGKRIRLCNGYGPSETTIAATFCDLTDMLESGCASGEVPIGRPIPNVQVHVLDHNMAPVSAGVAGELFIGGAGLARGYLNRPDLTAESFIPNPFSDRPDARLYRTGDLVRLRSDGNLEFVGRMDQRVKIRGYRVETEEIETLLRRHPAVWETVVTAREDSPGDKRLVAYVVPVRGSAPKAGELRSFVSSKLPRYMIPSAFVFLAALPLAPNGKIDRRALPPPDPARPELAESYVAPRTQVEQKVASIWAEVLRVDRVGIHDNFFDLGGNSLNATRVVSRIREAFQLEVPLRALFEQPTVSGFAATIIEHRMGKPEELASILDELEELSDEEMRRMLLLANFGQKI